MNALKLIALAVSSFSVGFCLSNLIWTISTAKQINQRYKKPSKADTEGEDCKPR